MADDEHSLPSGEKPIWHPLPAEEIAQRLRTDLRAGLSEDSGAPAPRAVRRERASRRPAARPAAHAAGSIQRLHDPRPDRRRCRFGADRRRDGHAGDPGHRRPQRGDRIRAGVPRRARDGRAQASRRTDATVLREGQRDTCPRERAACPATSSLLEAGNIVPADLRLCEAVQLRVDESALTGESVTVEKQHARAR